MPINKKLHFHFLKPVSLSHRGLLKQFIGQMFRKHQLILERLDIIFCDDSYLLSINQRFLGHDTYTDIISFPLSESSSPLVAEIYISVDRLRENASSYGVSLKEELHRVIFHGVLHFCGFKDKKPKEIEMMRKMERLALNKYFKRPVPRETAI